MALRQTISLEAEPNAAVLLEIKAKLPLKICLILNGLGD